MTGRRSRTAAEQVREDQAEALTRALGGHPSGTAPEEPPSAPDGDPRASERALRLGTFAAAAFAAALLSGRPWVTALAVPPLVLLLLGWSPARDRLRGLHASGSAASGRVFEGETVRAVVRVDAEGAVGWLDPGVHPGAGLELTGVEVDGPEVRLAFTAHRWGHWNLATVDLDVHDRGGLVRRTVRCDLGEVEVFPPSESAAFTPVPVRLPERIGEHTARRSGEGVEAVGVRPFVHGERQRRIHWAATTRRGGEIQLIQFAAEQSTDVVVVVDAFADLHHPATGASTLDDTVRVGAGIVRAYLRGHDRVGVVSVGGKLNWLPPGDGGEHFYRVVQTVLDVRRDFQSHTPDLDRLPPPALPRGALVYAVTPLADARMTDVLGGLTERGNPLVVVEVPAGDPAVAPGDSVGAAALRLLRLEQAALRWSLREQGVQLVTWEGGDNALDLALGPLTRTRLGAPGHR